MSKPYEEQIKIWAAKRLNAKNAVTKFTADDISDVRMEYSASWGGCETCGYGENDGTYDVWVDMKTGALGQYFEMAMDLPAILQEVMEA